MILPATAWPEKDGTVTNTDRMVQLGRKALDRAGRREARISGSSRSSRGAWASTGTTQHPKDVFNEMRRR